MATEIQCVNCKTINPEIANYCRECGEPLLIEYASTPRKVLAFLIDLTLLTIVSLVLMGVIFLMVYLNPYSFSPGLASGVWLILSTLIFFCLSGFNGKKMGKPLVK
nr:RDD family protein [Methanobacterium formicicum]